MSKRNVTTSIWTIVEAMQRSLEAQGLDVESVDNAINLEVVSLVSGLRSRGAGRVASPEARDLGTGPSDLALQLLLATPAQA